MDHFEIEVQVHVIVSTYTCLHIRNNLLCRTRLTAARLAQSVEHQTFNLRVKGSSPLLGAA